MIWIQLKEVGLNEKQLVQSNKKIFLFNIPELNSYVLPKL
jgi:hypothetical protein